MPVVGAVPGVAVEHHDLVVFVGQLGEVGRTSGVPKRHAKERCSSGNRCWSGKNSTRRSPRGVDRAPCVVVEVSEVDTAHLGAERSRQGLHVERRACGDEQPQGDAIDPGGS